MRIQVYPENGIVFVGTEVREVDLSHMPDKAFAEFQSTDTGHPYYKYIAHLIPEEDEVALVSTPSARAKLCWATTAIVDGHRHNTFTFDNIGDVLPWHTHTERDVHTSEVVKGSFTLTTAKGDREIKFGDPIIDWEPGEWHGFKALEAGSVLLNRVKAAA